MSGLPAGVETVTVTSGEPLVLPDGTPYQGRLIFSGPGVVTIGEDDVVLGGAVTVPLINGNFSVTLVANDAIGMSPTGWTYEVLGMFVNAPSWTRHVLLPKAVPAVVLADILVPDPVEGSYSVLVDSSGLLAKAQNLGDLPDASAARGHLGLGNAATKSVGTTTNTVAAGDDSRMANSRPPSGPASGDLSGTYPDPRVAKINGITVSTTPPNAGDALVATDATHAAWAPVSSSSPWVFDITKFGGVGDAKIVTDGAVTAGVAVLTCPSSTPFTGLMVGMPVLIHGAGPAGVTEFKAVFTGFNNSGSMTLSAAPFTNVTGGMVTFGTNNYTAVRAASAAAEAYIAEGHPYAEVYTPPVGGFVIDGALDTSKFGNGQVPFGLYAATAGKKAIHYRSDGDGAGVRHWEQLVPQISGGTWISFGFYTSTSAQLTDLNANGNPGIISGPNEGTANGLAYGAAARYSNILPMISNMAFLVPHTAFGVSMGAANLFGCANAHIRNVSVSTLGVVPSTDYQSPGVFATGLSIGILMPAPGNNDLSLVENLSIQGGFTYAIFFSEHTLIDRIMVLYCWAALCLVGSYAGSVGSAHEMRVLSASVEACAHEVYIVGAGAEGVGPIIDIHLSTESSAPNVDGNSLGALMAAVGPLVLTGLYTLSGVAIAHPTGIEIINGQSPRAVSRKTASFTANPIDRTLLCNTSGGAFTATLPDADVNPVEYVFRNTGTNVLTVATVNSQLIIGTASPTGVATVAVAAGQTGRFQAAYDGSAWNWYQV